jgi:starch synthase
VIFVGRVTRQKGVDHLLAAAAEIDRAATIVVCGSAPDTPVIGVEMRARADAARAAGATIVWIEDVVPRPDLVQLLTHATVFVCPSVYEPFGLVNLEAMACATPVVASAVGGIPEIVDDFSGVLVPFAGTGAPLDPAAFAQDLAAAVNHLLADPPRAAAMGAAGRARAVERFAWPAIARQTVALYQSLLGR